MINVYEVVDVWVDGLWQVVESKLHSVQDELLWQVLKLFSVGKIVFQWRVIHAHKIEFRGQVNLGNGAAI